jgi:hypothetical protein
MSFENAGNKIKIYSTHIHLIKSLSGLKFNNYEKWFDYKLAKKTSLMLVVPKLLELKPEIGLRIEYSINNFDYSDFLSV